MSAVLDSLVQLLTLEPLERLPRTDESERNLFRGQSQDLGWGTVFGGQVLGQALSAATQTVPNDRVVHSLHAYFLRPGDVSKPIIYDVDRIRDGSSFTTRRVVAIQNGEAIFNLAASFQKEEEGYEHQDEMPSAPDPESLPTEEQRLQRIAHLIPKKLRERTPTERPFDVRRDDEADDPFQPKSAAARRMVWFRAVAPLGDDLALHRCLLAYVSDFAFVTTALLPHGVSWLTPGMQVASLDHVMWFHQPFRVDEWLLHVIESPKMHGARGLVRGRVFTRDGRLVASTSQEGLLRRRTSQRVIG